MLSATDIASVIRCRHRVYLDRFGDPAECVPFSDFVNILWRSGRIHESDVIAGLPVQSLAAADPVERERETLALMAAGAPLIYHARLAHGDLVGEPDLLKRVEAPSRFGAHAYVPADIKSGAALEGGKPKRHYVAQLCAYAELLEAAQGVRPRSGWIIDRDNQWVEIDLAEQWAAYEKWRADAREIDGGRAQTSAASKSECGDCVWIEHCDRDLRSRDDVTLVGGVGEAKREKLWMLGIRTVAQLAEADPALLAGAGKAAADWQRSAATLKRGTPEMLSAWRPPDVDFEVSYDIEDYPFDESVYLHGLLVRGRNSAVEPYDGICAVAGEPEASVWRRFLDAVERIDRRGEYCVYVYSHHEATNLERLVARHGGSAALERFRARFVDLREVVRGTVVFPTESNSLKDIANFCGFRWRDSDPGGKQSIAWWANYLADPAANGALRDRLLRYNEDDVRASFAVRDWISAQKLNNAYP